jgi:hypothetical protein
VINSYAQLIKDYPSLNWKLEEYAQNILEAGSKAAAVTRQLLAFSRKQVQGLKIIDLSDLALRCCEMLPRFIGEDIRLEVRPHKVSAFVCSTNSNRPDSSQRGQPGGGQSPYTTTPAPNRPPTAAPGSSHDNGPTSK